MENIFSEITKMTFFGRFSAFIPLLTKNHPSLGLMENGQSRGDLKQVAGLRDGGKVSLSTV